MFFTFWETFQDLLLAQLNYLNILNYFYILKIGDQDTGIKIGETARQYRGSFLR